MPGKDERRPRTRSIDRIPGLLSTMGGAAVSSRTLAARAPGLPFSRPWLGDVKPADANARGTALYVYYTQTRRKAQ
jgi:hypothetical protein